MCDKKNWPFNQTKASRSGFTLLEIILAIGLLVFSVCFLAQTMAALNRFNPKLAAVFQNVRESINVMEQVKSSSFEAVSHWDGYHFLDGRGQVKVEWVSSGLRQIKVWAGDATRPEVYFETLLAD